MRHAEAPLRLAVVIALAMFTTVAVNPSPAVAQGRSIFSVLDTQGRSVATSASAEGRLSDEDLLAAGGRRVQVWALSAAPGAELRVDLRSADFDSFLYVVGPGLGEGLGDDDGGDGLNSRLCVALSEFGEYRVVASSLGGETGNFTLQVSEAPGAANGSCGDTAAAAEVTDLATLPTDGRTLSVGDDSPGILGSTDPIVSSSPAQAWAVEGRAGQPFSVDLVSEAFDAYLLVQGPGLESWLQNDDGAGRCDARISFTFPQNGTYRVVVTAMGSSGGPFRLIASERPGDENPNGCRVITTGNTDPVELDENAIATVGTLSYDVTATGTMTGNEGRYAGRNMQGWTLSGTAGSHVSIELRSASFDSFLYLSGPGFPTPLSDDDGAGNLHSRICLEFPETGDYRVLAGPLGGAHAGERYTLLASIAGAESLCESFELSPSVLSARLSTLPTDGRSISIGEEASGFLDGTAERHPETNQLIQAWSFAVQADESVYLDVVSSDFDALLYIVGPGIDGSIFIDDFDTSIGCNPRVEITPSVTGTLTVLVGSYYEEASGDFLVRATTDPPPLEGGGCVGDNGGSTGGTSADPSTIASISSGAARRIEVGTEAEGSLGLDDETLPRGAPAQPWSVMVEAGDDLIFEVLSDDFDSILYLDGPGLFTPLFDDDGAGQLDSRIAYTATESGLMRLVVTAIGDDGVGTFRLRVIRRAR